MFHKISMAAVFCSLAMLAGCEMDKDKATISGVDLHNKKCVMMPEHDATGPTAEYDGKVYHFCCEDCEAEFKKDPAKYAKAVAADPAKYGVKTGG